MDLWTDTFKAREADGWAIVAKHFLRPEEIYEVHVDRGLADQRVGQLTRLNQGEKGAPKFETRRVKVYVEKFGGQ